MDTPREPQFTERQYLEALYRVFQEFALNDQRRYYRRAVRLYRKAASQANLLRALMAFLTGLASAFAGLIVTTSLGGACSVSFGTLSTEAQTAIIAEVESEAATPDAQAAPTQPPVQCTVIQFVVFGLVIATIVAPAIGAGFTTLADLFQWDRVLTVYESALENLEVADAQSPTDDMEDVVYRASLRAYAEGTLAVMRDETAQWGQLIKTPEQLDKFIQEEMEKAARSGGSADHQVPGRPVPPPSAPEAQPQEPPEQPAPDDTTTPPGG